MESTGVLSPAAINQASQKHPLKDIAYGSIAGICSKFFEHPFDLVKVRLQSQPLHLPSRYAGPLDCFRQTAAQEGLRGLYRGVSMPVIGAMAENATLFLVYGQTQRVIRRWILGEAERPTKVTPLPIPYVALSAACAGASASFVLTPIELVKCRMQVQQLSRRDGTKPLAGPTVVFRDAIRDGGLRGLWLGQTGTLLRETGGSAVWFCTFETASSCFIAQRQATMPGHTISKDDLSSLELMASGALAGVLYNIAFFPADSIKSTIQTASELQSNQKTSPSLGFLEVGRQIIRSRGWSGLYAGCGLTCLRSAPSSALIFWIVSRLESRFG